MSKSLSVTRLFSAVFLSLVFAVVASCSGDGRPGDSTTGASAGTGSVALLLTDAPSDIFEEININVIKAELLSDDGKVTVFEGERSFNLLELTDARIFAIREGIPAGSYSKIRLTLTEIELVDYNGTDDPADDNYYYPKLPGNGKLDLKPDDDFDVVAGGTLTIQIDMDANKSIHIVKKGNKDVFNFRPVVFITIVTDAFKERFVKLHGDIAAIDSTAQSFKLCNTDIPVQIDDDTKDHNSNGCLRVTTDDSTAIFDSNGSPTSFIALVEGEPATVFGRLQRDHDSDDHDGDDEEKDNDDVEDDQDYDDKDYEQDEYELHDLVLKAALIELGPETGFVKLNGTATSAVDSNDQFTMDVDPGQGLSTPLILNVQIQKGSILINRKGEPVASADIDTGKLVTVRGVLDVSKNTLFASLIIVDTDSSTRLSGTVGANPDSVCGFTLVTASGDRSVATDSNTKAFLIVDGSSSPISVNELGADQSADVYGEENSGSGCFDAHTIIAFPVVTPI